jgi:hypothetical protein
MAERAVQRVLEPCNSALEHWSSECCACPAGRTVEREMPPVFRRVGAAPVQEQMGLKRGHRIPARCARLAEPVVYLIPLKGLEKLPGVLVLLEQSMLLPAVHATIQW